MRATPSNAKSSATVKLHYTIPAVEQHWRPPRSVHFLIPKALSFNLIRTRNEAYDLIYIVVTYSIKIGPFIRCISACAYVCHKLGAHLQPVNPSLCRSYAKFRCLVQSTIIIVVQLRYHTLLTTHFGASVSGTYRTPMSFLRSTLPFSSLSTTQIH